jgi:Tol biopolymer transport system component
MHSNEGVLESILINGIDGFCWQESWSPDGQWILFYGSDHRLYRVRPDGSDFQSIAASLTSIFNVTWSPDSHWLIFQREDSIYRMRPDGTERRRIATGTILYNDETWSPDSEWLVIAKNDAMAGMQPYLLRSDGSDLNLLSDYRIIGSPEWSPDGEWIIFEISENLRYEVYRIRPDGSNLQQITHLSGRETILSWSPDSQWIMLNMDHGTRSIQLGRVRANGGDLHSFPYSAMSGVFWGPSVDIPYRPGIALILGGGMVIIGVALSKRA